MTSSVENRMFPPSTPMDIRLGLTKAEDVAYPLRWGIIGAGNICRQWAPALQACEGATLSAVAAREEDRAKTFAQEFGVEAAYGSYAEMVASPDVDVVYVGTSDDLHKEHCLLAIAAGKHVLCEKNLAENPADAREMYTAAEEQGVMLQDGVWTRFFPAVEHARVEIESGTIGDIVMVQSDFTSIYTSQAVTLAFGAEATPTVVVAAGKNGGGAILEFEDERCAVLTFIQFPSEFAEVTEFIGTKGRITLEQPAHSPTAVTIRVPEKAPSRYMMANAPAPAERFEYPLPDSVSIVDAYPNQEGFLYQAEAVHRCLAAGLRQCPQYDKASSLATLELVARVEDARKGP